MKNSTAEIRDEVSTIQHLKTIYKGNSIKITNDYVVIAKVVSSDRWHNFDNSLVCEDNTGGIEIRIYQDNLFLKYEPGATVKIRCNGMILDEYGGTLQLTSPSIDNIIILSKPVEEPLPNVINAAELSYRYINCLVKLGDAQFITEDIGKNWVEADNYTERHLVFRQSNDTVVLRTSPQATFASSKTPMGSGEIQGILQYFAGKYSLKLVTDDFLSMDNPRF